MISEAEFAHAVHVFPGLGAMDPEDQRRFREMAVALQAPAGHEVFRPAAACEFFFFPLSGAVRVTAESGRGREILLYRVDPGELCILSVSCALGHERFPARGTVLESTRAIALPVAHFEDLVQRSEPLRRMVFGFLSRRVHSLMGLVEEVAFRRLDQRVARRLWQAGEGAGEQTGSRVSKMSHQELADELGSARELVSRVLADMEAAGLVALGRRRIEILDRQGLAERAGV